MKYLIILLILVSIATVSCRKNSPVEPVNTNPPDTSVTYLVRIEVENAPQLYVDFFILISRDYWEHQSGYYRTPRYWSIPVIIPGGNLSVTVLKQNTEGTLYLRLRDLGTNQVLATAESSEPWGAIDVKFP